ncbi:alpha/beta fold hydrolase [Streptomyces sp. NPDC041068]|uniref:lipase family alpha/beta hydrolase n=1 Tax=Streptomyces sp. NPDC041068 TaxID=3155130 RepID=UPI0034022578
MSRSSRTLRSSRAFLVRTLLTALAVTAAAVGPAAAQPMPAADPIPAARKLATPNMRAFGVNDWSCRPGSGHPRPLVLVHGTLESGQMWKKAAPVYKAAGYCVFALDYGRTGGALSLVAGGVGRVADSAKQLGVFVEGVLAATGAGQVDVVGHSQGGMMPRQYMKFEGGAKKVHTLVGISPSNHGTRSEFLDSLFKDDWGLAALLAPIAALLPTGDILDLPCPACTDQMAGSKFLTRLGEGGDTLPGVTYQVIASKYDTVVTPPREQFLQGDKVSNVYLQDVCPDNRSGHQRTATDPLATRIALNALDPAHAVKPSCLGPLGSLLTSVLGLPSALLGLG